MTNKNMLPIYKICNKIRLPFILIKEEKWRKLMKKYRYPWPVIETAVLIHKNNKNLTYRSISEKMLEIGVTVSHKTVYQWVSKFKDDITFRKLNHTHKYTIEESYVRCNGEGLFMYSAIDLKGATVDIFLRPKRNIGIAKKHFAANEQ